MSVTEIVLAPGASGTIERLHPHRDGLMERGLAVELLALPRGTAERALPVYRDAVPEGRRGSVAIGGQSFGGRVASMVAAESAPAALVLMSYPLHAPGRHDAWHDRTAHWPAITCPVLLLSGEADPFARLDLLRQAVDRLPDATVHTWPALGHGLTPVLEDALDRIVAFLRQRT